ncbi:MAG TPA: DUF5658 family protein [Pyrinomonadaceae bacterium]|nr:DUF5658 family protein [Pyrinomonadaceae bacterium]
MGTLYKSLLLFGMNWMDAQLTLLWIRLNVATEGNALMARLLDHGALPFLSVKLAVGAVAAYVLYRSAEIPMAKLGMKVVLGIYGLLMMVHLITGLSVLGWHVPQNALTYLSSLPSALLTFFS